MMDIKEIHSDDRRSISLLSGLLKDNKEFTIIHLNSGKAIGGCLHDDVEYMCVVDGEVFVTIGCVHEFLMQGDSREIKSNTPHMFVAKKDSIIIEWGVKDDDKWRKDKNMREEVDKINAEN